MISANIPREVRRAVYRRDGYMCALCGDTRYLQVHHAIKRSLGGSHADPHNLITLCSYCHGVLHGNFPPYSDYMGPDELELACVEYLADYYAPEWMPWEGGTPPRIDRT